MHSKSKIVALVVAFLLLAGWSFGQSQSVGAAPIASNSFTAALDQGGGVGAVGGYEVKSAEIPRSGKNKNSLRKNP